MTSKADSCDYAISIKAAIDGFWGLDVMLSPPTINAILKMIKDLPPVNPQQKAGYCKDCKYFERDFVEKINGIPIISAHEICKRWGGGCKTKEDGYCFLYEPQESEGQA